MANFIATTASNGPRLKDSVAAKGVIASFCFDGDLIVEVETDSRIHKDYLVIYGTNWPGAWPMPRGTNVEDLEPNYDEDSGEGWERFLNAIAPYLDEPLTVQAVGSEKCRFPLAACEWRIEPGNPHIEVNQFKY